MGHLIMAIVLSFLTTPLEKKELWRLAWIESNYHHTAVSPDGSCCGMWQLHTKYVKDDRAEAQIEFMEQGPWDLVPELNEIGFTLPHEKYPVRKFKKREREKLRRQLTCDRLKTDPVFSGIAALGKLRGFHKLCGDNWQCCWFIGPGTCAEKNLTWEAFVREKEGTCEDDSQRS